MANNLTAYQLRVDNATWVDVNPQFTLNLQPERFSDEQSIIYCSFFNMLNCPIGARARIFEPEYGSSLMWFIHQPIGNTTAQQIKMALMQCFSRWEPRVKVNFAATTVTPDYNLPGYKIRISATFLATHETVSTDFNIKQ